MRGVPPFVVCEGTTDSMCRRSLGGRLITGAVSTSRRNILVTFQAETLGESRCRVDEEITPGD